MNAIILPEKIVTCKDKLTIKEKKDLLKLGIDKGISIEYDTPRQVGEKGFVYMTWNRYELEVFEDANDSDVFLTKSEFIKFISGKLDISLLLPYKKSLKLNEDRIAIITKENVAVGCAKFSHEIIEELYKLSQQAQKSKQ